MIIVARCAADVVHRVSMQEIPIVSGFTAGELTPWLATRFDLQAYQRGAARISNLRIQPFGGVELRPGTGFLGESEATAVRLFPFCFAQNDTLMLEFIPGAMRVYKEGALLRDDTGNDTMLQTPWTTAAQLDALHFNQVNDAVYVCCPTHPPVVLYRYTDTTWRCEEPEFNTAPREIYAQQHGLLSVIFEQGGQNATLSIDGGEHCFSSAMENTELVLADAAIPARILFANSAQNTNAKPAPDLSSTSVKKDSIWYQQDSTSFLNYFYRCIRDYTVSDFNGSKKMSDYPHFFQPGIMRLESDGVPYEVQKDWELTTTGTWNAHWELWRSYDTPEMEPDFRLWNWTCIKSFTQSDYETRQNWAISGSETRPCRMVLVCRCCSDAEVLGAFMVFKILSASREYRLRITGVTDERHARARVLQTFYGSPISFCTRSWSFGAMGARNGYPAFSAMFQGRLWLAGMPGLPTTLLASVVDDYQNFRMGSNDDDAMHLSIMGSDQSRICWLCATRQLLIGTSDSEWGLVSGTGSALTPTSVAFRRQSSVGSEGMPARAVENTVLFVQRGGRRMREIAYRLESDGFAATDISMLAEHLFVSGVKDWCVQRGANFNIWVRMNDDSVSMLTINLDQQVTAWQRVVFAGRKVLAMAALPSSRGKDDEMWFVMQMEAGGGVVMERMCSDSPHLDCMQELTALSDENLLCGGHLAGSEVRVVDIETDESATCRVSAGGLISAPVVQAGRTYRVGFPIEAMLQTMPLESPASFNSVRQFSRFKLRLLESDTDFEFCNTANEAWERVFRDYYPGVGNPYTGALRLAQMPDAAVGQALCIRYNGHHDFRILAITQEVDHHGK